MKNRVFLPILFALSACISVDVFAMQLGALRTNPFSRLGQIERIKQGLLDGKSPENFRNRKITRLAETTFSDDIVNSFTTIYKALDEADPADVPALRDHLKDQNPQDADIVDACFDVLFNTEEIEEESEGEEEESEVEIDPDLGDAGEPSNMLNSPGVDRALTLLRTGDVQIENLSTLGFSLDVIDVARARWAQERPQAVGLLEPEDTVRSPDEQFTAQLLGTEPDFEEDQDSVTPNYSFGQITARVGLVAGALFIGYVIFRFFRK